MAKTEWLKSTSPAFRLMIATSWLAPESWRMNQEQEIWESVNAGPDWLEFIRLVDRHRTPALTYAALKMTPGISIPEAIKHQLQQRSRACHLQAIRHCRKLALILRSFNCAEIPVMILKGPILSHDLYRDVGLRQSNDLDVVVAPVDIKRALACLQELGWQLDPGLASLTPRQWQKFHQMNDDFLLIQPNDGSKLELHSRIYWDSPERNSDRWARSSPRIWQGGTHQALQPNDQLLFLCAHGGYHAWFRAKWLGDMARIYTQHQIDWRTTLNHARNTGQERVLLACLRLLHIVHRFPLPDLPDVPWSQLPPILISGPLQALNVPLEPFQHGVPDLLHDLHYAVCFPRLTLSQKTWTQSLKELLYCRQDYRMFPLPDRFFWAYAPLRPVLYLFRKLMRALARGGDI